MANLAGFSKESKAIIEELEDYGWVFTVSSPGHAIGRAPDGETTCSVPKKLAYRSRQNAEAALKKWRKVVDEAAAATGLAQVIGAIEADPVTDPVIDGVLAAAALKKSEAAIRMTAEHHDSDSEPAVISLKPWLSRMGSNRKKGTTNLVENDRVMERKFSDGTVDWLCTFEGCDYVSAESGLSVARHYGAQHTRSGESEPRDAAARVAVKRHVPVENFRAESTHTYTPTKRLLDALAAYLDLCGAKDVDGLAFAALQWFHDRPDLPDAESAPHAPMTDAEILARVRLLVGGRDLALEARYEAQVAATQAVIDERDAALAEVTRLADVLATLGSMAQDEAKKR